MFGRSSKDVVSRPGSMVEPLEGRRFLSASVTAMPTAAALATDPGGAAAAAADLGALAKGKLAQADTIGTGDAADFFKFTVATPTTFSATVKGVGKPAKLVRPVLVLSNEAGTAATSKKPTAAKQTLGPGTYFLAVNGQPTGTADYKLTVVTKPYAGKKPPTFTSSGTNGDGGNNGGNNGGNDNGGTNGGTKTGTVQSIIVNPSANNSDTFRFKATQTGTFELPASFAADALWSATPLNNPTTTGFGGGGIGPGDGTLSVAVEAGVEYIFNIVGGNAATAYSVTFDTSFAELRQLPDDSL